jgi:LacI family transcriptional regulator, gluconate utilization system Gnt-I transcriptional repressor
MLSFEPCSRSPGPSSFFRISSTGSLPGVDAVFAANDAHAIGFMSGLRTAGLLRNGPAAEQLVALIGLGDLEMGRLIAPSLSTIRVNGDAIGRSALAFS